jgi:ribonuclease P protein component
LNRSSRFGPVLGRGRRFDARLAQLIVDRESSGAGELGVIVGRKVLRSAVARNRARRVLRELYRRHRARLHGPTVIFRIRQAPADPRMRDLVDEARRLLDRAFPGEGFEPAALMAAGAPKEDPRAPKEGGQ